jgi:hypothetical protein
MRSSSFESSPDGDLMWSTHVVDQLLCILNHDFNDYACYQQRKFVFGNLLPPGVNPVTLSTKPKIIPKCRDPRNKQLPSLATVSTEEASNDTLVYTVCPQSPVGVLKNCGAKTNCGLRQIIVTMWKFFTDLSRPRCGLPW